MIIFKMSSTSPYYWTPSESLKNFRKSYAKTKARNANRQRAIAAAADPPDVGPAAIGFEGFGLGIRAADRRPNPNGLGHGGARRVKPKAGVKTSPAYPPLTTTLRRRKSLSNMSSGLCKRYKRRVIFPTKKRPSRAQRIVSTITPTRSLTYQFNGVVEGQNPDTALVLPAAGPPTPFSSAEFAYGATTQTAVPSVLSGIYGNVAQDKSDPGCNAWVFQTLFHGSQIDQLSLMCAVNSDAQNTNAVVGTSSLNRNRFFYISSYRVTHTLHNPLSTPIYVNRYEIVPRVNCKNVGDLYYGMRHLNSRGDYEIDSYIPASGTGPDASARLYTTPDVNPNEFPMWRSKFRIVKKTKFTIQPGQSIDIPFVGKLNKKVDMMNYLTQREMTSVTGINSLVNTEVWATDATYMARGLTKILAYQAFGIPAVQGTTGNTTVGSVLANRATTTPAQFILRSTMKISAHGAVDTARRYTTMKMSSDGLENATSAVSGIPGSTTHAITVTNQI